MKITVTSNLKEFLKSFDAVSKKQIPFATAKALTATAEEVKAEIAAEMETVFENPTKWTLNSLYMKPATTKTLAARVWVKNNKGGTGPSPEHWLLPEVLGGPRKYKRFEKALKARGLMPADKALMPTQFADIDSNGNVSSGQITSILSYLQAFDDGGYRANMTKKGQKKFNNKRGFGYFSGAPNGQPGGIWKRINFAKGTALRPVFLFVALPQYRPRLDFFGIGGRVYKKSFNGHFRDALRFALQTAKK